MVTFLVYQPAPNLKKETPSRRDGNISKADNGKKMRLPFKTVK